MNVGVVGRVTGSLRASVEEGRGVGGPWGWNHRNLRVCRIGTHV